MVMAEGKVQKGFQSHAEPSGSARTERIGLGPGQYNYRISSRAKPVKTALNQMVQHSLWLNREVRTDSDFFSFKVARIRGEGPRLFLFSSNLFLQ